MGNVSPSVCTDFEAVVKIENIESEIEDFKLEAKISVTDLEFTEITLISPKDLKGLSYVWDEDGFEMEYLDLHLKTEEDYLPPFTFSQGIYNVLTSLGENKQAQRNEEGLWVFTGESQSGEYEVLTDDKGYIKEISVKEINLIAVFEYE